MNYTIKCDDCKTTIGETADLSVSAAGGRCATCKPATPGPWDTQLLAGGHDWDIYGETGRSLALVRGGENEASARLIAAAPLLLDELRDAVRMLKVWDHEYGSQQTDIRRMQAAIDEATL